MEVDKLIYVGDFYQNFTFVTFKARWGVLYSQIVTKKAFNLVNMEIKMINKSNHELPGYETEGSAGFDLRANVDETLELKPFERKLIPTGVFMELPEGCEAQIRPRSGMAVKKGITLLNTPGTIDSDYRGEVKIILINLSDKKQSIKDGERIAQAVISRYEKVWIREVAELGDTVRGGGGFGHTGDT